jgi:autotransporter-associated beta strand protein
MTTFTVTSTADTGSGSGTSGDLRYCIENANLFPGSTIQFDPSLAGDTITLASDLPMLDADVTIDGGTNNITISGADQHRIFFANTGQIKIENLTLANGLAKGGDGGSGLEGNGGGGGMGAGGALFVRGSLDGHMAASVTLVNVGFSNDAAHGGNGGSDPDSTRSGASSGGGGGMGGNGGSNSAELDIGGAGGGGAFPGLGQDGEENGLGGNGGGFSGGSGGNPASAGGDFSGGGGGLGNPSSGGAGGFGGGGGGSANSAGASGGFGGGGGGNFDLAGGSGGFGGGGGGSNAGISKPGIGGFGGGNGGTSNQDGGGGGAGMGGAVFVMQGASLTIVGKSTFAGDNVHGGTACAGGTDGQAFGGGMFLQGSGRLIFQPGVGHTLTISDGIDDEKGVVAAGYMPPSGFVTGSWGLTIDGRGTLVLSGDNTYSGGTTLRVGTLVLGNDNALGGGALTMAAGTTLAFNGNHAIGNAITGDPTVQIARGQIETIAGPITGGGELAKTGLGTLVLSGNNTYSGGTALSLGRLILGNDNALGGGALAMAAGTTLAFNGNHTIANSIAITGDPTFQVDSGQIETIAGPITGDGELAKRGGGALVLSGDNTYSGATIVSAGSLVAGSNGAFSKFSAFAVAAGAILDIGEHVVTIGSLSDFGGSGGMIQDGDSIGHTLTTGGDNTSTSFSGTIQNGSGVLLLIKTGTGTFTLNRSNTYTGLTFVNAGKLVIDGSIVSNVGVNSGGTLAGHGSTGTVTVESGGTLSPGDSPGILHSGNVSLAVGANFVGEIGGTNAGIGGYDRLVVNGTVDLGGATLDISLVNGFHPILGQNFEIISNDGSEPISGTFSGQPQGAKLHAGGSTFSINYDGGDGNDVVLNAVPAVTILIKKAGNHLINASHTVAGQPLPTNDGDLIICRKGNDRVHAGTGNDVIVAGPGRDALFGGAGADTFVFRNDNTHAHIRDFEHGVDKLEFAKSVFKSAGHIHYNETTGALIFHPENASQSPVQIASLATLLHINNHDFLFL